MHNLGWIELRGKSVDAVRRYDRRVKTIDQDKAASRRFSRSEKNGVIAPRTDARDRARGEPAETIGFEPLVLL
jgi:hypothetical protein